MTFASSSVTRHLCRGLIGLTALTGSLATINAHLVIGLALLGIALVALRGCPICWTIGLAETIAMQLHARADRSGDARSDQAAVSMPRSASLR